jgi:hypothetical protein
MRVDGEFSVPSFAPTTLANEPKQAETAVPIAMAIMEKRYTGGVEGRSATVFTSAFNHETGVGSYVAMESFEGSLGGRAGSFVFLHTATTHGTDRSAALLGIVPGSGAGELAGIDGGGGIAIDADGTHRVWFEFELEG